MKKMIPVIIIAILTQLFSALGVCAQENDILELYVSPNGSDINPGTKDKPVQTLKGAQNKVRQINDGKHEIHVIFSGGEYRMTDGVVFDEQDSGTEEYPIIYMAAENETPVFKGSKLLDASKFQPVTNKTVYNRLPESSADKIGELDLKEQGITSLAELVITNYGNDTIDYNQFYLNGKQQTLARWPNNGFANLGRIVNSTGGIAQVNEPNAARWGTATDPRIAGFLSWDWAYERTSITAVDPETRYITINVQPVQDVKIGNTNARYFVYNLLEELDSPGEWYIDKESMMLYYYPMLPVTDAEFEMAVLTSDMITMNNASYIQFKGFEFTQTCADAFDLNACNNITLDNNYYYDIGRSAVRAPNIDCSNIYITNSRFYNTGSRGVHITGGSFETLEESGNVVSNCYFNNIGTVKRSYSAAILFDGVGNTAINNVICNMDGMAIGMNGCLNKIMYNEIYDVCKIANDMGAIYAGRVVWWRGTEIAYNYIHDIVPSEGTAGLLCGVYFDDSLSGDSVHNNVFKNIPRSIFMGTSSNHQIYDNIFIDSEMGITIGVTADTTGNRDLFVAAKQMADTYPVYYEKFPEMRGLDVNFTRARLNKVHDNLLVNSHGNVFTPNDLNVWGDGEYQNQIYNNTLVDEFDDFIDAQNSNFGIKEDSEILKEHPGLADIDFDKIGVQNDLTDAYEQDSFIKTYPKNGSSNITVADLELLWEGSKFINTYHVVVATDPELSDIVFEAYTKDNYVTPQNILSGGNTYYWDVTAVSNIATMDFDDKKSVGSAFSFTTSQRDKLEQTILTERLNEAEELLSTLSEGDEPGQCEPGSLTEFNAVIDEARRINSQKFGDQQTVDEMVVELEDATALIMTKIRKGYTSLDNWLSDDSYWQFMNSGENSGVSDNELLLDSGFAMSTEELKNYQIYKFRMKIDNNLHMATISMRQQNIGDPWAGGMIDYSFYFKTDFIEFQRYVTGNGGIIESVPTNGIIGPDEWFDVEIGTVDVNGGVRIYLKLNDQTIFNYLDDSGLIKDDGYMQFANYECGPIHVQAVDELPVLDESILEGMDKLPSVEPVITEISEMSSYKAVNGDVSEDNGTITYRGTAEDNALILEGFSDGDEIVDFDIKMNIDSGSQGFAIRAGSGDQAGDSEAYYVSVGNDTIALERVSASGSQYLFITDNNYIESEKWTNIQFGAYPTDDGMRIVMYADGKTVFDYTDMFCKTQAGYLKFFDNAMSGIQIK